METPKQLFDSRVNVFPGETATPFPKACVMKPSMGTPETVPLPTAPCDGRESDSAAFVPDGRIETHRGWKP